MKLCKDCAHYKPNEYGAEFAECLHGAERTSPVDGVQVPTVMSTYCTIKRANMYDSDEQRESIQSSIDDGTSTLPPRYWPCGPEARYFVERPTVTIVTIPEPESRWERFVSWLRSWL